MIKRLALFLYLLAFVPLPSANAQIISLDGQYQGYAFRGENGAGAYWGFTGTNSDSGAALTEAVASERGSPYFYHQGYFAADWGLLQLNDGDGNGVSGFLNVGGPLSEPWDGVFTISYGTGRYEAYTGNGTVKVEALPPHSFGGPTTFTIKGPTAPAVPEPSSLLLVATSALTGLYTFVRRRIA